MITYRVAEEKDLKSICQLGDVVNQLHYVAWPSLFAPSTIPNQGEEHWRVGSFGREAVAILAEHEGFVVGFITLNIVNETNPLLKPIRFARLGSVCVDESKRGRGIGKELILRAEQWARDRGAFDIRLNAWTFNKNAIALYENLGYATRSVNMGKVL